MGYGQWQIRITHLYSFPPSEDRVNSHCELPLWSYYKAQYFWSRLVWVQGMNLTWLCNLEIHKLYHFSLWCGAKSCEKKKLYTEIAHYRKSLDCPIYTSILSPLQYYCSLSKVRTYTNCELLTFTEVLPPLFTSFSVRPSFLAGPDGRSWPALSPGSQGIFHGVLSARQQQQAASDPSLFPGLLTTRAAYALGTLDADLLASICVCSVKFNQDGICWYLMWVIVLYSTPVCMCVRSERRS